MLFAGLWERNTQVAVEPLDSYAVLTRDAEGDIAALRARMPLSLTPPVLKDWLVGTADADGAIAAVAPICPPPGGLIAPLCSTNEFRHSRHGSPLTGLRASSWINNVARGESRAPAHAIESQASRRSETTSARYFSACSTAARKARVSKK